MNEKDREVLMNIRAQARLVERMREKVGEESGAGLRAVSIDGMPRGSLSTQGLDAGLIRREQMRRMLQREEAALRRMERRARLALESLPPDLYAFSVVYYIDGLSLPDAADAIDRSERQCKRYKSEIER